jgi:hypothetical protein
VISLWKVHRLLSYLRSSALPQWLWNNYYIESDNSGFVIYNFKPLNQTNELTFKSWYDSNLWTYHKEITNYNWKMYMKENLIFEKTNIKWNITNNNLIQSNYSSCKYGKPWGQKKNICAFPIDKIRKFFSVSVFVFDFNKGCLHWVHLHFCCEVRVLRTHSVFYCPCQATQKNVCVSDCMVFKIRVGR